jgi:HK97 gp10 family phage protein
MEGKNFSFKGMNSVKRSLSLLPKEFGITRKRNLLKKGLDPFIQRAKSKAPVKSGVLRESIGIKTFRNNKTWIYGGVMTDKKIKTVTNEKFTVDGFYAKWLEFGFTHISFPEKGQTLKNTKFPKGHVSEVAPKPFLIPAWDETKGTVRSGTVKLILKRLKAYEKKQKRNIK